MIKNVHNHLVSLKAYSVLLIEFLFWKPEEVDDEAKEIIGEGVNLFSIPFKIYCPLADIEGYLLAFVGYPYSCNLKQ